MSLLTEFTAIDGMADYLDSFPKATREAARIALNDVTETEGLAIYRKGIEEQINFPQGYVDLERLGVTSKATDANLRVVVTGRQRATSLARFVQGSLTPGAKGGVAVRVHNGGASKRMEQAFLVRLNRGTSQSRDNFNLGLAIRLKPGEKLRNKKDVRSTQLDQNVFLLYGPSVDQVFREIAVTETPPVLSKISTEFFRQFFRLVK